MKHAPPSSAAGDAIWDKALDRYRPTAHEHPPLCANCASRTVFRLSAALVPICRSCGHATGAPVARGASQEPPRCTACHAAAIWRETTAPLPWCATCDARDARAVEVAAARELFPPAPATPARRGKSRGGRREQFAAVPIETVRRRYMDDFETITAIAEFYGVATTLVRKRLQTEAKLTITGRHGPEQRRLAVFAAVTDRALLRLRASHSVGAIARRYHLPNAVIAARLDSIASTPTRATRKAA